MIGLLALQGNFHAHKQILESLKISSMEIRYPDQLNDVEGLIIPGGESTTINDLMARVGFHDAIKSFAANKPILGTCAGLIMMSKSVKNNNKIRPLGILDIEVSRNAYGTQIDSFIGEINFSTQDHSFSAKAPFIRAPRITKISDSVEVIGKCQSEIVAIKSGIHVGLTFHPELSDTTFFHKNMFKKHNQIIEENSAA
tara:strand:- start:83 stop:676 length:594 start_codon:yes stop_codon:yes gene_type:complete